MVEISFPLKDCPKYKFYQKGKLPPKNLEAPNIIAATTAITPTTFTQGRKTTFAIIFNS